ncbi:Poly(ADP-ribose) glycohydrolase [Gryllus bimaculatus]|nr:Poly(ADP-ribose) glycohydrolase [Gryllus bimaculatus]
MALVMLPCDLPWWPQVQRQLTQLALSRSSRELIETMEKIHSMCNISLDPDEEAPDPALFQALERFLEEDLTPEERRHFLEKTSPAMVMSSKDWLTIEDWLECGLPLVPLLVRHEGRLDRAEPDSLHVCFSSSRVGGDVLSDGFTQECLQFCTQPELLTMLSCVEALEDNEVLAIDGVMQVARISGPRHRASMDPLAKPPLLSVCCMDAEIYTTLPISQLEEDNVLRELNKALLGFRQKCNPSTPTLDLSPNAPPTSTASSNTTTSGTSTLGQQQSKRLSPIGESFSSTPPEKPPAPVAAVAVGVPTLGPGGRRGRFIVLGSSGECLPVSRAACSLYSSCQSESDEEFHSARTSLEHDDSGCGAAGPAASCCRRTRRMRTWSARGGARSAGRARAAPAAPPPATASAPSAAQRTLSDSFAGAAVAEGAAGAGGATWDEPARGAHRIAAVARSLSLELARHNHRLAAQLLDTVARVLLDRRWTVGELVTATLRHAQDTLQATAAGSTPPGCLFDELLGMEKPSAAPTTTL